MTDGTAKPAGWKTILLGVSLAANVFFIGLFGGKLFEGKPEGRDDAPNSFLASLSDDRKAEVKEYFKVMREDRKASRKRTRASWDAVREAMTADPYDRTALETAMQGVMDARTERSEKRYAKMLDFVSEMSVAERTAFSDAMRERYKRRREARKRREGN